MEHNKIENDDDDTGARKLQRPYLLVVALWVGFNDSLICYCE